MEGAKTVGVCEGYATAATIKEALDGIPIAIVCAFDSDNLAKVGKTIQEAYPNAKIVFLSDNDRHTKENIGLNASKIASNMVRNGSTWIAPDFGNLPPLKQLSDFNDLARECGIEEVRKQILKGMKEAEFRET